MSRDNRLYAQDVLTACEKILRYVAGQTCDVVWDVVSNKVPELYDATKEIINHI